MTSMWLPPDINDLTARTPKQLSVPGKKKGDPPIIYTPSNRPSAAVDTVVLHQMAVSRGSVADNYLNVAAHFAVLPDGSILKLHPITKLLYASSMFNDESIAIEFAGNFPNEKGIYWEGDKYGRSTLSSQQINQGRDLLRYLQLEWNIQYVYAHRQGEHPDLRENCCGPDIWYNIGQWAVDNLGMDDGGPGFKVPPGTPIPDSWRKPRT